MPKRSAITETESPLLTTYSSLGAAGEEDGALEAAEGDPDEGLGGAEAEACEELPPLPPEPWLAEAVPVTWVPLTLSFWPIFILSSVRLLSSLSSADLIPNFSATTETESPLLTS
jgi:hypothetical protein